jgi:hypothetical protein
MNQLEEKLQQRCYTFFHNTYPNLRNCLWRVENERKRSTYQQSIAKSTGLTAGVADFNLLYKGHFYAIELKIPGNGQTQSQYDWQNAIRAQRGSYYVIYSLQEFKDLIRKIVGKNPQQQLSLN